MNKHKILIDCGFGWYSIKKRPQAVGNEFLYYEPSLLLWSDELICDKYAFEKEREWAEKGYVVSEVFVELKKKKIVKVKNFEKLFEDKIKFNLLKESGEDIQKAAKEKYLPTHLPYQDNIETYKNLSFHNVNSTLYLSYILEVPFITKSNDLQYYKWKLQNLNKIQPDKERKVLSQILNIYVPHFELFPKNCEFYKAENSTKIFYASANEYLNGKINGEAFKKEYSTFLEQWLMYDTLVRNQVVENLDLLINLRKDNRFRDLRFLLNKFAKNIIASPEDKDFHREVDLRLKKEILETEIRIAEEFTIYELLDKITSYISLPIEVTTVTAGAVSSAITENPFFFALSLAPSIIKRATESLEKKKKKDINWYYYLLDFEKKINRIYQKHCLERDIEEIEKNHYYL